MGFKLNPLFIILAVIVAGLLFLPKVSQTVTGFDTIALQKAELRSSDPAWDGDTYLLSVAVTGSSGHSEGTFSSAKLSDYGLSTNQGFTVTVDVEDEECRYPISNNTYVLDKVILWSESGSWTTSGYCYCKYDEPWAFGAGNWNAYCGVQGYTDCGTYHVDTGPVNYYSFCPERRTCYATGFSPGGVVAPLDPTVIYYSKLKVTVTTDDGKEYTAILDPNTKTAEIDGVMRVNMLGALMGSQSCPMANTELVAYVPLGKNEIYLKDKFLWNSVYQSYSSMKGSASQKVALKGVYDNQVANFKASNPNMGQYCSVNMNGSLTSTMVSCKPMSQVQVPLLNIYLKADTLGIYVPSGNPHILGLDAVVKTEVSEATKIKLIVKNDGETDSFDVNVDCGTVDSTFSLRETIEKGETANLYGVIQAAGFIGNCKAEVRSVNSPNKADSQTFTLKAEPFCALSPPSTRHEKVNTEYGCAYICPNQYSEDVFEDTCGRITNYDRCKRRICPENTTLDLDNVDFCTNGNVSVASECQGADYVSYSSMHCTGTGLYTSTDRYMDYVATENWKPFIPEQKANMVWLDVPYCKYVASYGYSLTNGILTKQDTLIYDYTQQPTKATIDDKYAETSMPADQTAMPVQVVEETVGQISAADQSPFDGISSTYLAVLAVVGVGLVVLAKLWRWI